MTTHRWTCGGACAVLGVLLASLAGCSALARPSSAATEWTYVVAFRSGGEELQVELRVPGGEAFELSIPEASRPFLDEVRCTIDGNRFNLTSEEDGWSVPASAHVRSVQWTFRARDAARTIDALGLAAWRGGAFVGSPSAFLLVSPHPASNGGVNGPRMSLAVRESNGIGFACALDHQDDLWTGDLSVLQELPTCAFGALSVVRRTVDVPSGPPVELTVARARATNRMDEAHGTADADREALRDHRLVNALVADADGLARYIGRFPVDRLLVVALPRDGRGVGDGVTRGYGGASIVVSVDPDTSPEEFRDDWVLTHEMIHLALPSLPEEQHWLEEGSATYLEPLVRASAGTLDENAVWTSMLQEYDQGLPKVGCAISSVCCHHASPRRRR